MGYPALPPSSDLDLTKVDPKLLHVPADKSPGRSPSAAKAMRRPQIVDGSETQMLDSESGPLE